MRSAKALVPLLVLVLGGWGTGAAPVRGDEPTPKTGEELVDRVESTLRKLSGASFDVDGLFLVEAEGADNKMESHYTVRFERPRRWAVTMKSDSMDGQSVSDGKQLTTYLAMTKRFTVQPIPDDWDPATATDDASSIEWRVASMARRVMGYDLKSTLEGLVESSEVKEEKLDGKPCWVGSYHVGPSVFRLWVSAQGEPLVQRIEGDSTAQGGGQGDAGAMEVKTTTRFDFKNWNTKPKFTDADFTFTPPEGAEEADSLLEGMGGPPEIHPLVGEPAPAFEVDSLEGEPFKLEDLLKKNVVMLDFWATWCGPCVAALPEVAGAAEATKDKGVLFYAVNIQEDPEQIKEFLKEHKLDVPVLLDAAGEIAQKYQVSGIPQTVLIGKDGRVQVVHVGFGGDAKATLIKQLTALSEGKDLAKETLAKRDKADEKADAEEGSEGEEGAVVEEDAAEGAAAK